jgi:hypothetical protein
MSDIREYENPVLRVSVDLTKTCPLLAHLRLARSDVTSTTWMALSAHPNLKSLELSEIQVEAIDTPWFWKACEKLEKLYMYEVSLQGPIPEDLVVNRLHVLDMRSNYGVDEEVQRALVYRSTMLEFLEWELNNYDRPETRRLIRHPIHKTLASPPPAHHLS